MSHRGPRGLLLLAIAFMVIGVVLPFLMVLGILAPTFALCFLSFALSLGGIILGLVTTAHLVRPKRGDPDQD
jgi:membrane protein implicated in regulation of membrane protease activity